MDAYAPSCALCEFMNAAIDVFSTFAHLKKDILKMGTKFPVLVIMENFIRFLLFVSISKYCLIAGKSLDDFLQSSATLTIFAYSSYYRL